MAVLPVDGRGRVTDKTVRAIPLAQKGQVLYWHPTLPGFGVRVGKKARVYICQAQVKVGGRKRDRRETIGSADVWSLADAADRARELITLMQSGVDPKHQSDGIDTLEDLLARARESRGETYASVVDKYMADFLERRLVDIDAGAVERRYREIIEGVRSRKKAGAKYSAAPGVATANGVMRALSAAWNFVAALENGIPDNPVRKLATAKVIRKTPTKDDVIPEDKMAAFWDGWMSYDWQVGRDLLALLVLTGIRRNMACAMRIEEFVAGSGNSGGVIRFDAARVKSGKDVELPVSAEVAGLLERRAKKAVDGWLFPSSGKTGHVVEPRFGLDKICEGIDGLRVSVHGLRRTFGSAAMFEMGEIQRKVLMMHSLGGDVTSAHYSVTTPEALRPYAQRVSDRLIGLASDSGAVRRLIVNGAHGAAGGPTERSERRAELLHDAKAGALARASKNAPEFDELKNAVAVRFGRHETN